MGTRKASAPCVAKVVRANVCNRAGGRHNLRFVVRGLAQALPRLR